MAFWTFRTNIMSYDENPLRKDELEDLIELFETIEVPDTTHPLA